MIANMTNEIEQKFFVMTDKLDKKLSKYQKLCDDTKACVQKMRDALKSKDIIGATILDDDLIGFAEQLYYGSTYFDELHDLKNIHFEVWENETID